MKNILRLVKHPGRITAKRIVTRFPFSGNINLAVPGTQTVHLIHVLINDFALFINDIYIRQSAQEAWLLLKSTPTFEPDLFTRGELLSVHLYENLFLRVCLEPLFQVKN